MSLHYCLLCYYTIQLAPAVLDIRRYDVKFYSVGNGFIRSANQTLDIRQTGEASPLKA